MSRRWSIVDIADANAVGGQFFFSPATMRAFGDDLRSFEVRHIDGRVFIQRVKPSRKAPRGYVMDTRLREFNTDTGAIGCYLDEVTT